MTLAVEQNRAADDGWVGVEARSPERFRKDGHVVVARLLLVSSESPPANRLHAEQREQVMRHSRTGDRHRLPRVRELGIGPLHQPNVFD